MPSLNEVHVKVIAEDGHCFAEYGVATMKRSNLSSCYIESITGRTFKVQVAAKIPFAFEERRQEIEQRSQEAIQRGEGRLFPNPPMAPDYNLLVSVYFDGRSSPERRAIAFLDPEDDSFQTPIVLKHTCRSGPDRQNHSYVWRFSEVGVDTLLDQMCLDSGDPMDHSDEEAGLEAALRSIDFAEDTEKQPQLGEIKVVVERVTTAPVRYDPNYKAPKAGQGDVVDMAEAKKVSHTTERHEDGISELTGWITYYSPYKTGEKPWATFKFYYRSEEHLQKLQLLPNDRIARLARKPKPALGRNFNQEMAMTTPLSITNPTKPNEKPKETYEAKVHKMKMRKAARKMGNEEDDDASDADDEYDSEPEHLQIEDEPENRLPPTEDEDVKRMGEGVKSIGLGKRVLELEDSEGKTKQLRLAYGEDETEQQPGLMIQDGHGGEHDKGMDTDNSESNAEQENAGGEKEQSLMLTEGGEGNTEQHRLMIQDGEGIMEQHRSMFEEEGDEDMERLRLAHLEDIEGETDQLGTAAVRPNSLRVGHSSNKLDRSRPASNDGDSEAELTPGSESECGYGLEEEDSEPDSPRLLPWYGY